MGGTSGAYHADLMIDTKKQIDLPPKGASPVPRRGRPKAEGDLSTKVGMVVDGFRPLTKKRASWRTRFESDHQG